MGQNALRCSLHSAKFPLVSTKMGRSIILPQFDQNMDRSGDDKVPGVIPQVYYMHNVIPTVEGFQSVSFTQQVAGVIGVTNFDRAFTLRDSSDNTFTYSPGQGFNYIFNAMLGIWQSTNPFDAGQVYSKTNVSYCYLQGLHYLCIQGQGVFRYNPVTNSLDALTFSGITMTDIVGVASSSGYLIIFDDFTVYWSSVTDPTDFVPSLTTGASSGTPTDLKGRIVSVLQISGGIIVYSTSNAVSAQYTGNIRFPFTFKEVVGSGGIQNSDQVSYSANFAEHYAITSVGLQRFDRNQANIVFEDVADFLAMRKFESFDYATQTFTEQFLTRQLFTKIALISSRYLLISYGTAPGTYTHALFCDMALKRWGKLKIDHVDCFEYGWPNPFGIVTYEKLAGKQINSFLNVAYKDISAQQREAPDIKTSVAFLQSSGAVFTLNVSDAVLAPDSVFILGKFQHSRSNLITLHTAEFDDVYTIYPFECRALYSLNGNDNQPSVIGALLSKTDNSVKFGFKLTGINVSLMLLGTFNVNTIVLNYSKQGKR